MTPKAYRKPSAEDPSPRYTFKEWKDVSPIGVFIIHLNISLMLSVFSSSKSIHSVGWKHHQEFIPYDGQVQRQWRRAVTVRAARWCCNSMVLSLRRVQASPLIILGVLLPPLRAPAIPCRGAIKGNWDIKTA